MANYGFSIPKELGTDEHFCSDSDVAVIAVDENLYLVYKLKGVNELYASKGSKSGVLQEMGWSAAVNTGQLSDSFPAITYFNGEIYVFWKENDGHNIYFGTLDPDTLKIKMIGEVPNAQSKQGVAAVVNNGKMVILHIGKAAGISGRSIYQVSYDGNIWSGDEKVKSGQSSKDAPILGVSGNTLYMTHRGKTDGIAGNTIYWSKNGSGDYDDWSDDEPAEKPSEKAESQHRPGGGTWNNSFVVVHNGNTREKLRLVYMDLEERDWYGDDHIGEEFKSNYGAAFVSLADEAYLIFADTDSARTLKWAKSDSIHT